MEAAVLTNGPAVTVALRRSARARRMTLRVSALDGRVTLTLPARGLRAEAVAFARSREGWVRAQLACHEAPEVPRIGSILAVAGVPRAVMAGPVRAVALEAKRIVVPAAGPVAPRLAACLRVTARTALAEAAGRHARSLGRAHGRITLRDTRSRWGSCTAEGDLMFSWRLILAPPEVLDYVAAHEAAHLERMDHSPAFWAVVARLMPDYAVPRRWLRDNGAGLHRWRFE